MNKLIAHVEKKFTVSGRVEPECRHLCVWLEVVICAMYNGATLAVSGKQTQLYCSFAINGDA